MKRLLTLALLATAALAGSATPSFAGTFGLFYCGRWCDCCCGGVNIRPYNAFTPVCGGVGEFSGGGGGCWSKWGNKWGCGGCDECGGGCAPYFGIPFFKKNCCYLDGTPVPGAPVIIDGSVVSPSAVAGYVPSAAPAGTMPPAAVQPASYQPSLYPPAYPAYPVYPMGYAPAPTWGGYPMPAYYPAPASPQYWYPMGR